MSSPFLMRTRVLGTLVAAFVFAGSWLYRYNDPEGTFGGLTDDHFFYVIRGWQILLGELPVRDFVDQGAPLMHYVSAALQAILGRSTWSEIVFCVTALSLGSALTCWLATRASGSVVLGTLAALFQVALYPRFYSYPKIIVYALAIPGLWAFADRPSGWRRFYLVSITAVGFLLRHDHGVFLVIATVALLAFLTELPWRTRVRQGIVYGALVVALLAPYLAFLQLNGGLVSYVVTTYGWSERDRERAPLVLPEFRFDTTGIVKGPGAGSSAGPMFHELEENFTAWLFYLLVALPFLSLVMLLLSNDAFRPGWPRAAPKIATIAILGIALNAGFLRHPLVARFGDVSVPQAILGAWILAAGGALVRRGTVSCGARSWRIPMAGRLAIGIVGLVPVAVTVLMMIPVATHRLGQARMLSGPSAMMERARDLTPRLKATWPLEGWTNRTSQGAMALAYYLRDCTKPTDRLFVSQYLPHVIALTQRGFAGGHPDLRPGFFGSQADQELTVARLKRQSVPVAIVPADPDYAGFRKAFPLVDAYFQEHYEPAGDRDLGAHLLIRVLVNRTATPTRWYEPLDLACFR